MMFNDSCQEWLVFAAVQTKESIIFIQLDAFSVVAYLFNLITFPSLVLNKMDLKGHIMSEHNQRLQEIELKMPILMILVEKNKSDLKKSKTAGVHKSSPLHPRHGNVLGNQGASPNTKGFPLCVSD